MNASRGSIDPARPTADNTGPNLIAHRGGAGLRIENTLAAFGHAIALGADGAELDVHMSRDGHVVVHHDAHLNADYCRHVDGDWIGRDERLALADLTYAQMQNYDIGAPRPDTDYAREFSRIQPAAGQRIPLLQDVVQLASARSTRFFLLVEIKAALPDDNATRLESLVDATLAVLRDADFMHRAILCSFDWRALRYAGTQCADVATWFISPPLSWFKPGIPPATDVPPDTDELHAIRARHVVGDAPWFAGFDPRHYGGGYPQAVAAAGGDAWYPHHTDCTRATCRQSARFGLDSAAWSTNLTDACALQRVVSSGVHNLTVDYPNVCL